MAGALLALIGRELRLALRAAADTGLALGFFVAAVVLLPLAVGPDPVLLARLAAGYLWVAALLASVLSLDRLFVEDHRDGTLDLLAGAPLPLPLVALAKAASHWLVTGAPMTLLAPFLGLALQLPEPVIGPLVVGLAIGTPSLSLIGTLGAALAIGARRTGLIVPLLVMPLAIPVLILGAAAAGTAAAGDPARPHLLLLAAYLAAALPLAPWATAVALDVARD